MCLQRRDGTTHIVMLPLEFMQRLAALVPRPRLHLIRFHGVLAPHAKLRAQMVPSVPVSVPERGPRRKCFPQVSTLFDFSALSLVFLCASALDFAVGTPSSRIPKLPDRILIPLD